MRLRDRAPITFVLLSFLVLACSCKTSIEILNQPGTPTTSNDPPLTQDDPVDDPVDDPQQPLSIAGSWSSYATEVSDTCGFDAPEPYAPLLIEELGASARVTVDNGAGSCQETTRTRSGDTLTLNRTQTLDLDGAAVRFDLRIVYEFTADSFSGTLTQSFTDLSGTFTDLPCAVTLAVTGTRCDNCWTGCTSVQAAVEQLEIPEIENRLQVLAERSERSR